MESLPKVSTFRKFAGIPGDYQANVDANLSRLFPFFLSANYGWEKEIIITTCGRKGLTKILYHQLTICRCCFKDHTQRKPAKPIDKRNMGA